MKYAVTCRASNLDECIRLGASSFLQTVPLRVPRCFCPVLCFVLERRQSWKVRYRIPALQGSSSSANFPMHIFLTDVDGQNHGFEAEPDDSVECLMEKIQMIILSKAGNKA